MYWSKQDTKTEIYKGMVTVINKVDDNTVFLKGVPKEIILFCYLAIKNHQILCTHSAQTLSCCVLPNKLVKPITLITISWILKTPQKRKKKRL